MLKLGALGLYICKLGLGCVQLGTGLQFITQRGHSAGAARLGQLQ